MTFKVLALNAISLVLAIDNRAADEPNLRLKSWVEPDVLTGFLVFLIMIFFFLCGCSALDGVSVPPYQLQANSEKNKENNREWQNIWGAIEK